MRGSSTELRSSFFQGDLQDFKVEKTLKAPRVTKTRVISRMTDHIETLVNIGGGMKLEYNVEDLANIL